MKPFKRYITEMLSPQEVQAELQGLGYSIKRVDGKQIDIIADGDRVGVLTDIAKRFKGRYNPKGSGSSIGRAEIPGGVVIFAKPRGGGSGAGSDVTRLTESAQCLYLAAHYYGKDYTGRTLKSVAKYVDVDEKIDNIINKLPDVWIKSCMLTAETFKKKHRGRFKFHRGSRWVDRLEKKWKALNKKEQAFSNLNKWSPADIYAVTQSFENETWSDCNSILELNAKMRKLFGSGDVIGISLKQVQGRAKYAIKNMTSDRATYEFKDLTIGLRGFFQSNDGYLMYNGGKIQFRTFGSTWQGEIKGTFANMGKISGGPITSTLNRVVGLSLKRQNEIVNKTEALIDEMYTFYKGLVDSPLSKDDFRKELDKKDQVFWVSKWLTAQLLYNINKLSKTKKDTAVGALISYAASESDLSGPYCKIS